MSEARGTSTETDSPSGESEPKQERSNTSVADLEQGLRGLDNADQDIADLLANNWQRVLGVLALVLLAVWLYNQHNIATQNRQYSASESYVNIQAAYQSLAQQSSTADPKSEQTARNETLMKENIKLLKASSQDSVLSNFAEIYDAQLLINQQKYTEADTLLKPLIEKGISAQNKTSRESIAGDLASVLSARALLLQGEKQSASDILYRILQNGGIASVEAAVILASIADSDSERSKLIDAAKNASASHSSLAEDIAQELEKFGISLK